MKNFIAVRAVVLLFAFRSVPSYAEINHPLEANTPAPLPEKRAAEDHSIALHPDQLQALVEIEGAILDLDVVKHTLLLKDTQGHPVSIGVQPNTRILDANNKLMKLTDLKPNDHIRAYYNREDNQAQQIDHLPSVAETIMGK